MFRKFRANPKGPESSVQQSLGSRERGLLPESIHVEEELIPDFVRPALMLVTATVILFIIWAAVTNLKEVARAPGEIIPSGDIKVVQHLDGGVISEILTSEGQLVEKGQVLLRVSGSRATAELGQMMARLDGLRLREERLLAVTEGKLKPDFDALEIGKPGMVTTQRDIYLAQLAARASTLDILDKQIEQRRQRIEQQRTALAVAKEHQSLTTELSDMREDLASRRLVNRSVLLETRRAKVTAIGEVDRLREEIGISQQELAESISRRTDAQNQLRQDALVELGAVRAEIAELEGTLSRLHGQVDRLEVRAPNRGFVHDFKIYNVDQVIEPGAMLMQIVSEKPVLEAEVRIATRDIGFVKVGQHVNLRATSFDYARFGVAKGILKQVSPSSLLGDDKQPYYRGVVELDNPYVGDTAAHYTLQPGMSVEADILTGEKTLLTYLTKPVIDVISLSFSER
ncbi:MAG: HlyD family type I secretion periplasmic adaptor subunit [Gallionella sp.]|nr:HlyD family type I secretion periplasmic adaptor subunit [Gallionella sp.]